jgi:anti-sigma factor ChrR (cupin superfamily)
MTPHDLDALLVDYVLGTLDKEERKRVDAQVARDPALAASLSDMQEALSAVALAQSPLATPSSGRARLADALRSEETPKFLHTEQVARFFDLAEVDARAVLYKAAIAASWWSPAPGMYFMALAPGPRYAKSEARLLRFDGGATCPMHKHAGEELSIVFEGAIQLEDGRVLRAGEDLAMPDGTRHTFSVLPEGSLCGLINLR